MQLSAPELAGEAKQMAHKLVTQICQQKAGQASADQMFGIVSGGETVVSMDSATAGCGGRSQELALSFACHMRKAGASALPIGSVGGGTDGRDGQQMRLAGFYSVRILILARPQMRCIVTTVIIFVHQITL